MKALLEIFRPKHFYSTEFLALKQVMNKQIEILGTEVKRMNLIINRVDEIENIMEALQPTLAKIESVKTALEQAQSNIDRRKNAE